MQINQTLSLATIAYCYTCRLLFVFTYLALLLAHVTLRVLNPIALINPQWCIESLPCAIKRLMDKLNPVELSKLSQPCMMDIWFSCYLPMIKVQLVSPAKVMGNMDKMIDIVVKICDLHVSDDQVNTFV